MKHSSLGLGLVLVGSGLIASCSSSDSSGGGGGTGGAPGCVNLTVENALEWCSISVNGQTASAAPSQTVCVPPGSVTVTASPLSGFILGSPTWHGTDNDTGTTSGTTSTTTVTVTSGSKCVYACCPFPDGTGCENPDPAPCSSTGTGGASGTGGSGNTGGSVNTGGVTATGGIGATGGVAATGGIGATGGVAATGGVGATGGAAATGGVTATGGATGTGGASACTNLTVKNTLSWCAISVNNQAIVPNAPSTTLCVQPGAIDLAAAPASSSFKLGNPTWHGTDNDTGTTVGSTNSTTVTVAASPVCVWACCPLTAGTGCSGPSPCP